METYSMESLLDIEEKPDGGVSASVNMTALREACGGDEEKIMEIMAPALGEFERKYLGVS